MPDYDKYPILICKSTTTRDSGSISIVIARRLPHDLFCFAYFLVDLWKVGIKDAFGKDRLSRDKFEEFRELYMYNADESGLDFEDMDISEVKQYISRGIRIAKAVGTAPVDNALLATVGNLEGFEDHGSLYKCYKCGEGELGDEQCNRILKVAKKELKSGVAGTPDEKRIYVKCSLCRHAEGGRANSSEKEASSQFGRYAMQIMGEGSTDDLGGLLEGTPYECAIWKLSILAAMHGIKPAFFYGEYTSIENVKKLSDVLHGFGLEIIVTSRWPLAGSSYREIENYVDNVDVGLLAYKSTSGIHERIIGQFEGDSKLDIGELLGYPTCCIEWYTKEITIPIGKFYASMLEIGENLLFDKEKIKKMLDDFSERLMSNRELEQKVMDNVPQIGKLVQTSVLKYPFIPHIACPSCIEKENSPSALLNRKLEEFSLSVDRCLHDRIKKEAVAEMGL